MAITKSAKKALRQNVRRHARNVQRKNKLKDVVKEMRALIEQKKFKEAEKLLPLVYQTLDKTAKVDTIKKNTASRRKSRLTKAIAKAQSK